MAIDKIGSINNIIEPKKGKVVSNTRETHKGDSIELSSEAKQAAETARLHQAVHAAPDIRAERVSELKEQIAKGTYNFDDDKILSMVADRIADFLVKK